MQEQNDEQYKKNGYWNRRLFGHGSIFVKIRFSFELYIQIDRPPSEADIRKLCATIVSYHFIQRVSIVAPHLNDTALQSICSALRNCYELRRIAINCGKNSVTDFSAVGELITANPKIIFLGLNSFYRSSRGTPHPLLQLIRYVPDSSLAQLDLGNNQLNSEECIALARINKSLALDLRHNDIGLLFMDEVIHKRLTVDQSITYALSKKNGDKYVMIGPIVHFTDEISPRVAAQFVRHFRKDPPSIATLFAKLYGEALPENDYYLPQYLLENIRISEEYFQLCFLVACSAINLNSICADQIFHVECIFNASRNYFFDIPYLSNKFLQDVSQVVYQKYGTYSNGRLVSGPYFSQSTENCEAAKIYVIAKHCLQQQNLDLALSKIKTLSPQWTHLQLMFCADLINFLNYPFKNFQISTKAFIQALNGLREILAQQSHLQHQDLQFLDQIRGRSQNESEAVAELNAFCNRLMAENQNNNALFSRFGDFWRQTEDSTELTPLVSSRDKTPA